MKHFTKLAAAGVIAASAALTATDADAFTIDFTDVSMGKWSLTDTGTQTVSYSELGGFDVTLSALGGNLNFTTFDGGDTNSLSYCSDSGGPLACGADGVGVGDDEVAGGFVTTGQSIKAKFSKALTVTGFHFLDLFKAVDGTNDDIERALIDFGSDGTVDSEFSADVNFASFGGYKFGLDNQGGVTSITFTAGPGNDGVGSPDYAVAGINVVPLPAAAWLLMFASGGLIAAKRRSARRTA